MEVASRYELLKLRQLPIHMTWFGCIASWASEPKLGLAWSGVDSIHWIPLRVLQLQYVVQGHLIC